LTALASPSGSRSRLKILAVWVAGLVVIGLVVAYFASRSPSTSADDPIGKILSIAKADRAPAGKLAGPLLGGGTYDPSAYAGHVLVVNAWGSWCTPCQEELPALRRLAQASYPAPVRFLGIDVDDTTAAGKAMVARYQVPYASVFDAERTIYVAFAPTLAGLGTPGTVVIDAQGRVAATVIGPVHEAAMLAYLKALAAEKP
jgi:thiol-disulfide isomerase/thioredoxin